MNAKKIFAECREAFTSYRESITEALRNYKSGLAEAKEAAAQYKDETAELARRKGRLLSEARSKIATADKVFSDRLTVRIVPLLREALSEYVTAKPSAQVLDTLRVYREFGLEMSRTEIDSLLVAADGNFTALRALASVAKDSGFTVSVPTVEGFAGDIAAIDKLARTPVQWAPSSYLDAAVDVFGDKPIFRADGSIAGYAGPHNAVSVMLASDGLNQFVNGFDALENRWCSNFIPAVSEFATTEDSNGKEITPEQQRAEAVQTAADNIPVVEDSGNVEQAAALGRIKAEEEKNAAAVLGRYI